MTIKNAVPTVEPEVVVVTDVTPAPAAGTTMIPEAVAYDATKPTVTTTTYTIPPPTGTTTTTATFTTPAHVSGRKPCNIKCPYCNQSVATRVKQEIDTCTIVSIVILVIFVWPLFWIPLVCDDCKTTEHYCTHCHRKVGETPSDCCGAN